GEDDGAEDRERYHDHDAESELEPRHERGRRRPVARHVDDLQSDPVDAEHVDDADDGGAEEAGKEQRRAADRTHNELLEQAPFRVPRDDAEREEDSEDDAEKERREHREPEQEGAGEGARVDVDVRRRLDRREACEDVVRGEPEEDEERCRQQHDDRKHLPPHRLAEAVAHDRQNDAQETSSPTASRYVSSSVDVRTRTPYTCLPAATASATSRGASSRVAPSIVRVPSSVSSSTPRGRESSAGTPAATTSPARRIATRSQTSSISESRCELSRTDTPRPRSSSSRTRTIRRPAGSSAEVGSSRTSTRGEPTSACAIPRRCCIPFDMPSTRRPRASERATSSSSRPRSAAPPSECVSRWWSERTSSAVYQPGKRKSSARYPSSARAARLPARAPATSAWPRVARTSPTAIFTSVDLPAPFGPSSPTSSPSSTERSTPLSAWTDP